VQAYPPPFSVIEKKTSLIIVQIKITLNCYGHIIKNDKLTFNALMRSPRVGSPSKSVRAI